MIEQGLIEEVKYFYDKDVINPETGKKGYHAVWHPTFLYESLWNLIGLTIILISRRKNK